jgi:hypothetical protein
MQHYIAWASRKMTVGDLTKLRWLEVEPCQLFHEIREGKIGCVFEEIQILVDPIERRYMMYLLGRSELSSSSTGKSFFKIEGVHG